MAEAKTTPTDEVLKSRGAPAKFFTARDPALLQYMGKDELEHFITAKAAAAQTEASAEKNVDARGHASAVIMALYELRNQNYDVAARLKAAHETAEPICAKVRGYDGPQPV